MIVFQIHGRIIAEAVNIVKLKNSFMALKHCKKFDFSKTRTPVTMIFLKWVRHF